VNNHTLVLLLLALTPILIYAESKDINTKLLADLNEVIATGEVEPVDGITAAGQPNQAAFKVFADSGYTTVIDLRGEQENRGLDEPAIVEDLGMEYVPMPIVAAHEISFESAAKLDKLIADSKGPVLVHCASSNRVGALLALRKSLAGAEDESAMAHGVDGGLSGLAGAVQGALSSR
jgi:uncharacterized protein (TIGR01244 family)